MNLAISSRFEMRATEWPSDRILILSYFVLFCRRTTARTTAPNSLPFPTRCKSCKDSQALQNALRQDISASPDATPDPA